MAKTLLFIFMAGIRTLTTIPGKKNCGICVCEQSTTTPLTTHIVSFMLTVRKIKQRSNA